MQSQQYKPKEILNEYGPIRHHKKQKIDHAGPI